MLYRTDRRILSRKMELLVFTALLSLAFTEPMETGTSASAVAVPIPTEEQLFPCFTPTVTMQSLTCEPFNTHACVPIQCFRAETTSIPCLDARCPTTITETSFTSCQTECQPSCPTVTISCGTML
ncbi:hypothetical protein VTO42DRAFT_6092 [Malbranchea cinnamomea]